MINKEDYNIVRWNKFISIINFYKLFKSFWKRDHYSNYIFRIFTKSLKKEEKSIITKGREFKIKNYYEGVARFNFKELCDQNLGAEDYLNISKICNHIFIEQVPVFNEYNSNQQLRFITLIDILYEKKITLTLSMELDLSKIGTSKKHSEVFKRTRSRLHEMTMSKYS